MSDSEEVPNNADAAPRPSRCSGSRPWKVGDRVSRAVYMDDGTWDRHGDSCLENSPLKSGTVIKSDAGISRDAVIVRWDDGTEAAYLDHGLQPEFT